MKKLLTAVGAAALFANMAIAPAFADSLEPQTELNAEYQMVLPEGDIMSDAELAEIEGEWVWVAASAGLEVGFKYVECRTSSQQCGWQDYALAGAKGAAFGLIPGGGAAKNGVRFFRNGQRIRGLRVFVR
jgi:hypothetical protein